MKASGVFDFSGRSGGWRMIWRENQSTSSSDEKDDVEVKIDFVFTIVLITS